MANIASQSDVLAAYPALSPALVTPAVLAAASALCQRRAGGYTFAQAQFDEEHEPGPTRVVRLRRWPVASVQRVQADLSVWLNVSASGFRRAEATLATSGDPGSLVPTGIALNSTTAGVDAAPIVLPFSSYPTIQALAAAISANPGWSAVAAGDAGANASIDLRPIQGPGGCLATPTPFWGYSTDLPDDRWQVNPATGRVYLAAVRIQVYSYPDATWGGDPRHGKVRFVYTAGYQSPPEDIVQACAMTVKNLIDLAGFRGDLKALSAGNLSFTFMDNARAIPTAAAGIIDNYRSKRLA